MLVRELNSYRKYTDLINANSRSLLDNCDQLGVLCRFMNKLRSGTSKDYS